MVMSSKATGQGYRVEVIRSGGWWAITVPALGGVFSQAKRLDQVEDSAREAISLMLDVDGSDVGALDIIVTPPPSAAALLEAFEESTAVAEEAARVAEATRREVAELLRAEGLPLRDVGALIGVSHQRVSQLLAS